MLTRKDKEAIRGMMQEELKEALCRKITIERGAEKQGDPEKRVTEEEWNVLDFLAVYIPQIEGALRGVQEDVDHAKNSVFAQAEKIQAIGHVLLAMETAAKRIASVSDQVRVLNESQPGRGQDNLLNRGNGDWQNS